jgi:hypothetical protein
MMPLPPLAAVALMRDLIFRRRADTLLVRVAMPVRAGSQTNESLGAVDRLVLPVYVGLARDSGQ